MLRKILQTDSSEVDFTKERGGGDSARMELSRRNFREGAFYLGGTFHRGVSCEGREFFIECEPDLLVLFGKRSEIKQIKKFQLKLRSNIKTQK